MAGKKWYVSIKNKAGDTLYRLNVLHVDTVEFGEKDTILIITHSSNCIMRLSGAFINLWQIAEEIRAMKIEISAQL